MSKSIACKLEKHGRDLMPGSMDCGMTLMSSMMRRIRSVSTVPKASMIAMKGPPFTRKTEFANLIAASLGCPILSLEHFLDELQSPEREDEGFRIICRMAHHHLSRGLFRNVVIDSPLSSSWHLTQLTTVASSLSSKRARVVIIECKPVNVYLWKMKLERHLARHPPLPCEWYKPRNWEDVEKAIKVNGDYDERSVQDHGLVSKLVVDPLLDHPIENLAATLYGFYRSPPTAPRFVEAVKYMITRDKGDGPDVVVYHQWQHLSSTTPDGNQVVESLEQGLYCSSHGHNIIVSQLEHEASCMACQQQVMTSDNDAYKCKHCSLALHKECAESFDNNNTWKSALPNNRLFPRYNFPEEFACNPCRGRGKGFSAKCASCLFETHLRCRLMPTVIIKHFDTEEHLLTIVLLPVAAATEVYRCVVCGDSDRYKMYLCKICGVAYHYKCVTLPRRVKHEHGGHHHHLSMRFWSEEADDYICDECQELRDPRLWFYSCEGCAYEVHLSCVHQTSFVT